MKEEEIDNNLAKKLCLKRVKQWLSRAVLEYGVLMTTNFVLHYRVVLALFLGVIKAHKILYIRRGAFARTQRLRGWFPCICTRACPVNNTNNYCQGSFLILVSFSLSFYGLQVDQLVT